MRSSKKVRILCAEDSPATARLLQRRLQREGYAVDLAGDGARCLSMFEAGVHEVLALDHELPDMTGLEVMVELSNRGPLPATVMITGAGSEDTAVRAMKLGADDYIIKDTEGRYLDLLPQRIEQALDKKRLIREKLEAEEALRKAHEELEKRVRERTADLAQTNEELRNEIVERRRAEKSLKVSEERFRTIFESAQDCIFLKDTSRRYTLVNPAMEQFLQLPSSQIVGKVDEQLFDPVTAKNVRRLDERALQGDTVEAEHSLTVKGKRFSILSTRAPLMASKGEIGGICGISRDITDRTRLHEPAAAAPTEFPSTRMRDTLTAAQIAARSDSVVLLTGESGAGKDYLAKYIHDNSARAGGPFHCINCAAIPHELAEAEFFGHERGAFTGAQSLTRGLLELAEGGTLLLNEIGELPLQLQAKLLTFLDTWSFVRVGGRRPVKVNARLIAATNRELEKEVDEKRFRPDLYYRLNVLSIHLPPLRERREDIPILVDQIISRLGAELQLPVIPEVDQHSMKELMAYDWPGNIRELRNVLERGLILRSGGKLKLGPLAPGGKEMEGWSFLVDFRTGANLDSLLKDFAKRLISESLRLASGNKNKAARLLGISRHSLRRRMLTAGFIDQDLDMEPKKPVRMRLT